MAPPRFLVCAPLGLARVNATISETRRVVFLFRSPLSVRKGTRCIFAPKLVLKYSTRLELDDSILFELCCHTNTAAVVAESCVVDAKTSVSANLPVCNLYFVKTTARSGLCQHTEQVYWKSRIRVLLARSYVQVQFL